MKTHIQKYLTLIFLHSTCIFTTRDFPEDRFPIIKDIEAIILPLAPHKNSNSSHSVLVFIPFTYFSLHQDIRLPPNDPVNSTQPMICSFQIPVYYGDISFEEFNNLKTNKKHRLIEAIFQLESDGHSSYGQDQNATWYAQIKNFQKRNVNFTISASLQKKNVIEIKLYNAKQTKYFDNLYNRVDTPPVCSLEINMKENLITTDILAFKAAKCFSRKFFNINDGKIVYTPQTWNYTQEHKQIKFPDNVMQAIRNHLQYFDWSIINNPNSDDGDDDMPTGPFPIPGDDDDDMPSIPLPNPGDFDDDMPTGPFPIPGDDDDDMPSIPLPNPRDFDDDMPTGPFPIPGDGDDDDDMPSIPLPNPRDFDNDRPTIFGNSRDNYMNGNNYYNKNGYYNNGHYNYGNYNRGYRNNFNNGYRNGYYNSNNYYRYNSNRYPRNRNYGNYGNYRYY